MSGKEFYLEYFQLGPQVKVMAIDPETGIEVSIIAPESATKDEMTRVAVDKLKRMIAKTASQTKEEDDSATQDGKRGGILV